METIKEVDVEKNLLLKHPFTMLVAGSTGSGKTRLVRDILSNYEKITTLNTHISVSWHYGVNQPLYREPIDNPAVQVRYKPGFPEEAEGCDVLVLDDLQSSAGNDSRLSDLFTRYSHHRNVTVIFVVQNLFLQSKSMRNVSLNSHYLLLLSSRRDRNQISRLASQLYPGETSLFMNAYKTSLSREYGYLLVDLSPTTQEEYRLRTNILPEQYPIVIFQKPDGI